MNKIVFIDESGTLPDPKDRVIVVAAAAVNKPRLFVSIFKEIRKLGSFKKEAGELKFYRAGEKTKRLFFKRITVQEIDIFILIVEKMGRKIPDTPLHFSLLCWLLLTEVLSFYPKIKEVIFDRHFSEQKDLLEFNLQLKKLIKKLPPIRHVESQKEMTVNLADMVAGAVLAKESGKEAKYYKFLKERIVVETKINWPEVKRKLFAKKKIA